ncbi:hypothetical protein WME98_09405 [Sorangium sp. So ce296]|uniref:hypothetical protein n=1 Tax=Sorangium sp. So ce296 TaxID=3133296 RepID=UPI003F633503
MQQSVVAWAAVLLALASMGCGTADRCDGGAGCGEAAPTEADCIEALAAHRAVDGCGVFAISSASVESGDGTMASPVSSLARAIELARGGRRRVFACNRVYREILTIPSGIDIHGGFDCDSGWQYDAVWSRTVVQVTWTQAPQTIVPDEGERQGFDDGVTTLTDVNFRQIGPFDTVDGGQTAYGLVVESNAAVELIRSDIVVSHGARGLHGNSTRVDQPERARNGAPGNPGNDGCSAGTVPGGAPVTTICDDGSVSTGGKGGDGYVDRGEAGSDGMPLPSPNPDGHGLGGSGASAEENRCERGKPGQDGEPGADGRSGRGPGRMTRAGWVGESGTDGKAGAPGTAGGGGGAVGGAAACGASPKGGLSGGSGGSGGCGGKGGGGGGHGGASIGLVVFAGARATLREVAIQPGSGGDGGRGGRGQTRGYGGVGGAGGQLRADGSRACAGGSGGYGGDGGHGGGGTGGPSIGIAYVAEEQLTLENVTIELGAPGEGGLTDKLDGDKGDDGFVAETYRFSP